MPMTRGQNSEMLAAAKTLLSLKVQRKTAVERPTRQAAVERPTRHAAVVERPTRHAAVVARQLIKLCAESEQD